DYVGLPNGATSVVVSRNGTCSERIRFSADRPTVVGRFSRARSDHNSVWTSEASALRAGGFRPARPVVVEDRAEPPHGEDIAPAHAPDALELLRRPARLRRPGGPIIVEDRPAVPHDEDVALTRAPDA